MGTKRNTLQTATVVAAFAAGLGIASAEERGVTDTTIKIGNIGPFTGKAAIFNPLNYGSAAYMRYVNDQGGVHGRTFEIVFGDTACAEAKGIAAAKKMVHDEQVFMITVNPCSGVAMAAKPTFVQAGMVWSGVPANPKVTGSTGSGGDGPPPRVHVPHHAERVLHGPDDGQVHHDQARCEEARDRRPHQ